MLEMQGHFTHAGRTIAQAGFLIPGLGQQGIELGPSVPIGVERGVFSPATAEFLSRVERAEITGDVGQIVQQLGQTLKEFERSITSGQTAFPTRENLEAEAKVLVPRDTPVRNILPRVPGAGTATQWRQVTALGGGWATSIGGQNIDQGGTSGALRSFMAESGAPADHSTVYANVSKGYKLLGAYGSITGFAMASGANFQNQMAVEKAHSITNLMLNEENALINGDSTSTAAPWGDGISALAFDGLIPLIATGNGTPTAQVQTTVGALTLSHIDNQLARITKQGGQGCYMILSSQEIMSLVHLAEASGSIIRVQATAQADSILGVAVTGYKHPLTGEIVPICYSRFVPAGTMIFMSKYLPDGTPTADVSVLPQVQLPVLAPNDMVQGYCAQELAPTTIAPQVYAWIVTCYEVLRLKSALHACKSTGVTAV